jgi:hypothetical protein
LGDRDWELRGRSLFDFGEEAILKRLYIFANLAKCAATYIQQVIWAKKYLPRKNEGFRDYIQQTKFKIRYKLFLFKQT